MKRYRQWITWSVLAALLTTVAVLYMPRGSTPQYETKNTVTVRAWAYSPSIPAYMDAFERRHPGVTVQVKMFTSAERLYSELTAAITANTVPQLAEIDSAFGIAGLADTGALTPLRQELATADGNRIDSRFTASYRYENQLWALPYGGSVPVVYYNADLLGSAGAASASALAPFTWGRMTTLAKELTLDVDKDGETDIWGLAADRDTPWYLENMMASESASGRDPRVPAYRLWHDLVYRDGIMSPLDNHLATSDFINGQAAFLFASSDKRTTLERYIGGKFEFGVLPFPEIEGRHALLPRTSGFVMLQAGAAETAISRQLLQYLIGDEVQSSLLGDGGQFPVRADMIGSMERDAVLSDKERAVIGMIGRIDAAGAANPRGIDWLQLLDAQEKLESSSTFDAGG
ncbi:extracellular solute-binding protein [Paenibacillus glycinis]|uniref:Extracellular solute-binding protein n=1 Tax=Paenibacillus glycinis TaxID=2697035 RepID=A0ABW9XNJ7_9BACL|nr:extracellular solute-binding protein [Paenibacillus glycinis]NBD24141.1 extracellular solute-binding protein [Paenibacillus glycinis]